MKPDRRFTALVEAAQRDGWTLRNGSRHLKLTSPDGKVTMPVPGSSSDRRAVLNFRAQLRRAGVSRRNLLTYTYARKVWGARFDEQTFEVCSRCAAKAAKA